MPNQLNNHDTRHLSSVTRMRWIGAMGILLVVFGLLVAVHSGDRYIIAEPGRKLFIDPAPRENYVGNVGTVAYPVVWSTNETTTFTTTGDTSQFVCHVH